MLIVMIHHGIEMNGDALECGPLGGTETALIGAATALAQDPEDQVHVFVNTAACHTCHNVSYHPLSELSSFCSGKTIDVLFSIRQWIPFWFPIAARLKIYFSPDAYDQPFPSRAFEISYQHAGETLQIPIFENKLFFDDMDLAFCVGQWQAKTFVERLGFPSDKMYVTGNAIFPKNFAPLKYEQRKKHCLYSSTPYRGLEYLLDDWPQIQERLPDFRLELCSGMGVYGLSQAEDHKMFHGLYKKISQNHAVSHGSIKQSELAKIMCSAMIFTYPNVFEETFCISVLEAQAAGLPVVTSMRAGLMERITHGVDGFLIEGLPSQQAYKHEFIDTIVSLGTNPELWHRISSAAQKRARVQTYENLVVSWRDVFKRARHLPVRQVDPAQRILSLPENIQIDLKSHSRTIAVSRDTLHHLWRQAAAAFGYS